jgi:hypothetical protein
MSTQRLAGLRIFPMLQEVDGIRGTEGEGIDQHALLAFGLFDGPNRLFFFRPSRRVGHQARGDKCDRRDNLHLLLRNLFLVDVADALAFVVGLDGVFHL